MHANYQYIVNKIDQLCPPKGKVLDYGCGIGDIVLAAKNNGHDVKGVEKFYGGINPGEITIYDKVKESGMLDVDIFALNDNGEIPFPDNHFDLVVSNQVFEHVEELDTSLKEINRVLKTDGKLFCLFPSRGVLNEWHCGVPFVHWLPKTGKSRYYYLLLSSKLGLGYHKENSSDKEWAETTAKWLNDFTFYRSTKKIKRIFSHYFSQIHHHEDDFIAYRLKHKKYDKLASIASMHPFNQLSKSICRRYADIVLIMKKKEIIADEK
jgi:ubiquinone/menaquinone biosynthesis C-methylase UbiE